MNNTSLLKNHWKLIVASLVFAAITYFFIIPTVVIRLADHVTLVQPRESGGTTFHAKGVSLSDTYRPYDTPHVLEQLNCHSFHITNNMQRVREILRENTTLEAALPKWKCYQFIKIESPVGTITVKDDRINCFLSLSAGTVDQMLQGIEEKLPTR